MSSAFPAGGPSKISVNTTSASSRSTILCAVVDPTNPPPTTVTFFRLIAFSFLNRNPRESRPSRGQFWLGYPAALLYRAHPTRSSSIRAAEQRLSLFRFRIFLTQTLLPRQSYF